MSLHAKAVAALLAALVLSAPFSASALPCSYSNSVFVWEGASTVSSGLASALTSFVNSNYGVSLPAYTSASSQLGVQCTNNCSCGFGLSDLTMGASDNNIWGANKITVPLFLQTFNFFTSGNINKKPVKLTGKTSYQIFSGGAGQKWGKYASGFGAKPFDAGTTILRGTRSAASGTVALQQKYWTKSKAGYSGAIDGSVLPSSWAIDYFAPKALPLCQWAAQTKGAIVFGSVSVCKAVSGNIQALLKNRAGIWQNDNRWDLNSAIPRPLPPPTASWASVSLVFNAGPQTPPIGAFTYGFARLQGNGNTAATSAKAALNGFLNNKFMPQLTPNQVFPVPTNLKNRWTSYVAKIGA